MISPYKAGKNLSVLPGVVIGKNGEGDRSKTNPTILDNVTIGAGGVVAKDVSSNTIVAGNSAQVIKSERYRISRGRRYTFVSPHYGHIETIASCL